VEKDNPVAQFATLFGRRPKPRCPVCHKWNRVYLTGGSFLSECIYCGTQLDRYRPPAWGILVLIAASALALAATIPLLAR